MLAILKKPVMAGAARPSIEALVEEHYDDVYRFCARRVGPEAAADAAQETFLAAQRSLWRFRGDSTPRVWLLGIALNQCRRSLRGRAEPTIRLDLDQLAEAAPEHRILDREALTRALANLSAEHRSVVLMHSVEGLAVPEIARILEVPAGTVKSRIHYALKQLRDELTRQGGWTR